MRVLVLGTAAGGGLPQWNCACAECGRARAGGEAAWRTQECLAVCGDPDGGDGDGGWYLLNASPDIRSQLLRARELAPGPGRRQSPIRGVLLTDAELDHTLGLLALREAARLDLYATRTVSEALDTAFPVRALLQPYGGPRWHTLAAGEPARLGGALTVTPVALGAKRPRYAAGLAEAPDWVVGYRIEDRRGGGTLAYAPCLGGWSAAVDELCDGADCVILDGTFFRDDEMAAAAGGGATATAMGHLPIGGPSGSLVRLRELPAARRLYTHLNNTNPALGAHSPERSLLDAAGVGIAQDGAVIEL